MIDILKQSECNRIFNLTGKMVIVRHEMVLLPSFMPLIAISKDHAIFSNDRKVKWGKINSIEDSHNEVISK